MSRIIVDIETSGFDFEYLDRATQDYLLRFADSEAEMQKVKESLSFYPLTGEIVAIGMLNPDSDKGVVYYQDREHFHAFEDEGITYESGTEQDIIKKFWEVVSKYKQIVTFNGRAFDAPFIAIRSAVHRVKPSRNLIPNRYSDEHIDLLDRLTFYGITRKFALDIWCRTFGIKSPKSEELNGYLVPEMFKSGRYEEIARYCVLDLRATKELFMLWQQYIQIN